MKILFVFDEDLVIDKKRICNFLNNNNTKHLSFSIGHDVKMDSGILSKPNSFKHIKSQVQQVQENFDRVFCFTEKPYDDNYFFHEYYDISIYSFWGWPFLTNLSRNNGLLYFVIDYLSLQIDKKGFRHPDSTGCIYDFLWEKTGIDDGMRQAKICPTCLARVSSNLSSPEQKNLLEDLKILMNLLSNSSKWNQDILENVAPKEKKIRKRKSKCNGTINILIASPGDVFSERKYLLEKLESQFRRNNHEAHCSKRLIVHGWEELSSQPGYPQDIINNQLVGNVDFVVAIFKHKLGTPTTDPSTGKERFASGTVEELLASLDHSNTDKPLGMAYFYSKAPTVSLDSKDFDSIKENWDNLEAFKKSIQSKILYKPYTEKSDLLQTLLMDLEKNIIEYFE